MSLNRHPLKINGGIVILLALFCWGCSSSYHVDPLPLPDTALNIAISDSQDEPYFRISDVDQSIPKEWWLLFEDPQLTCFLHKTLTRNPTLQTARAKIIAAEYTADRVRAALFPHFNWGGDYERQKLSKTGVIPFGTIDVPDTPGIKSGIPEYFSLYETQINMTYNFDFWGKNKNTLIAALGQVRSMQAEEAFARLELGISVAKVYYDLQTSYRRLEIAKTLVKIRTRYVNLIQKRIKANLDSALSLQSADSNLSDAEDHLLEIQGNIAVQENQLKAYMADEFQEEIHAVSIDAAPLPTIPLPRDLPLHLLAQRPDITSQLWLIESAGKQIEVAKAGFYPDINLNAFFGYQTIHFAEWFKWPSSYFNISPAFTLPIFDGGLLVANLGSREVDYDLAILKYNELVIDAARQVLDALAVLKNSWQRLAEFQRKTGFQEELYQLTTLRVKHNLSNNLDELVSQELFLKTQDQEIIALGRTLQSLLELIKSIGGGYKCGEGSCL